MQSAPMRYARIALNACRWVSFRRPAAALLASRNIGGQQRPMQEVARQAIREYVEGHSRAELLDRVLDQELPRYAEALERLGQ